MITCGADIQTENGFVRIHPAILELLARQTLSGREFRCLMFLFRKTYGYHKRDDRISLSQWEQGTGIPRTRVGAVLTELVAKNIVTKKDNGANRPATWGFNKHFETWQGDQTVTLEGDSSELESAETVTLEGDTSVTLEGTTLNGTVPQEGYKTVTLQGDHNRKKDITTTLDADASVEVPLVEKFECALKEMNATKNKVPHLIAIYRMCFGKANEPTGSELAGAAKAVGSASLLAKNIFDLVSRPPVGPVLPYIIATENGRKKRASQNGGNREIVEVKFAQGEVSYE